MFVLSGFKRAARAFTLIELLIVVAIIAILAAIAVPNFLEAQVRAKLSRSKNDLRTLVVAFEAYRVDHVEGYPYDWNTPGGLEGFGQSEWDTYAAVTTPIAYISSVPRDIFQQHTPLANRRKAGSLYEFWGTDGNRRSAQWVATGTKFLMIGYGPDQDWDLSGNGGGTNLMRFINEISYDPTNGTRSSGDIGRSNVRMFPQ